IRLSREFPGLDKVKQLEVSINGGRIRSVNVDQNGVAYLAVSCEQLGWDRQFGAKSLFFRPVGWNDWFAVSFPQAYHSVEAMTESMAPRYRTLPTGQSIWDPLGLKGNPDMEKALRELPDAQSLGFIFAEARPSVHGFYLDPVTGQALPTAVGTAVTRYRLPNP